MRRTAIVPVLVLCLAAPNVHADDRPVPVAVEPASPAAPELATIETPAATLTFGSLLQTDVANRGERPGFSIHRARVSLDAEVERMQGLGAFVRLGVGEADDPSPLLDGVVRFRLVGRGGPDLGEFQIGRRKVPVSREVLREPEELYFVDRPRATRLAPHRDTGLLYHLGASRRSRRFSLDVGFWNGEGTSDAMPVGGGTMTTLRVGAGTGDPGRARPGMDWGIGYATNPDAIGPDGETLAIALVVDGEIRYRALTVAAETIAVDRERGGHALGFFGFVSYFLIADTFELRARADVRDDRVIERALTFGGTFHYLAPHLRLMVDHTRALSGALPEDRRTVMSFLFVL